MGFVYEEVGEENRELWESIGWRDWGENPLRYYKTKQWAIDREQQVYMQPIGGYIDMPDYHDISYKGRIIRLEIGSRGRGTLETGFDMNWIIFRIYIPKSVWEDRKEILKAIEEAFGVYRAAHNEEDVNSISVEISCEPECVEVDYNGR